ncbi:unnamed protein product [Schistocephalus solidus]|uniref:RGS domain-containing protein n=1 Tax=Schistocephalus solidus TaxID=70667 RepID=A0A3P7C3U1_SCHSO|nr:unnamed protein product [Schistocephalus solidus]
MPCGSSSRASGIGSQLRQPAILGCLQPTCSRQSPLAALHGTVRACVPVVLPNCKLGPEPCQKGPFLTSTQANATPPGRRAPRLSPGLPSGLQHLQRVSSAENISKLALQSVKIKRKLSPEQIKRWETSFSNLLSDYITGMLHVLDGLLLFEAFLKTEFSEENIQFWKACEDYRRLPQKEMAAEARRIYQTYLSVQSPREVNLDSKTRLKTISALATPNQRLFDSAQKKIQALMEKDSYQRFLRSSDFLELKKSVCQRKSSTHSLKAFGLSDCDLKAIVSLTELPFVKKSLHLN